MSKNNVSARRKFLRNISLGTLGAGLGLKAFAAPKNVLPNNLLPGWTNNKIRQQLMLQPGLQYFNTGSLGPSPKVVFDKVIEVARKLELNPVGQNWGKLGVMADEVRQQIAEYIHASKEEIIMTRNTTEGMNLVAQALQLKPGDEVITSTDEHYGGQAGWEFLEKYKGIKIRRVKFPQGNATTQKVTELIKKQISPRTKVCSLMQVSTVTGMRLPFEQIAKITQPKGILLVCDGAQSAGMLKVDVKAMGVDIFATSGHKWLLGPKETGFLYIKKEVQNRMKATQLETGFKVYNHNTGTRNVVNIVGLGEALRVNQKWGGIEKTEQHNIKLATYLRSELKALSGIQIISPEEPALQSALVSVVLKQQNAKQVYKQLKQQNIIVKKLNGQTLRFSPHIFHTPKDIDVLLKALAVVIK